VGIVETVGIRRLDPLGIKVALSLTREYFPLGFRLELATNSPDVLAAADEAWSGQQLLYSSAPVVMHVIVAPEGELSSDCGHHLHGRYYSVISDPHNFAQVDLDAQFAYIHVSRKTAADHTWLRWFFIEPLAYVILSQRYIAMLHAGCVARNGSGVLLCGSSTAGKSTLAYACARAGWTFVADDCTCLLPDSPERVAIGRSRQARFRLDAPELFPELAVHTARSRPTGKIGIEVPMWELPRIRSTDRVPIGAVVFLERRPGPPVAEPVPGPETVERVLDDMPSYGPAVDAMHEATVQRLAEVPAWRLRYHSIGDGVELLSKLL
jgi:hypothetical protein